MLDDPAIYERVDRSGMLAMIERAHEQARDAWDSGVAWDLAGLERPARVVVAGMGGSAIGADMAKRFGVPREVVHCIAAHHEEIVPETTEALIVIIADAMSGSRPGARRESSDQYIKRLEALEALANSFGGVERSFAIQAGREVRIIVQPEQIDDLAAMRLARDVSKKIDEALQYPG